MTYRGGGGKRYCDVTHVTFTARLIVRESEIRAPEGTAMESYTGISIRTLWAWYSHHSQLVMEVYLVGFEGNESVKDQN